MRFVVWSVIFILLATSVSASIELVTSLDSTYYSGSILALNFITTPAGDFSGVFKVALNCDNYNFDYFTTPLSTTNDQETRIAVPPLSIPTNADGSCFIGTTLQSADLSNKESFDSNTFTITKSIPVTITTNVSELKPGEHILTTISLVSSYTLDTTEAYVRLGNVSWTETMSDTVLEKTIVAPQNILPGKYPLAVRITDDRGNRGDNFTSVEILSVPTQIALSVSNTEIRTGELLNFSAALVDQANNVLESVIIHKIIDTHGTVVFEKIADAEE